MAPLTANSSGLWKTFELKPPGSTTVNYDPPASPVEYSVFSAGSPPLYSSQASAKGPEEKKPSPRIPKRIIICCDGTWQSSVNGLWGIPSNVTRLGRSIARTGKMNGKRESQVDNEILNEAETTGDADEEIDCQQIVYYGSGIGAGAGVSLFENLRQALFGDGLVTEVIKAYNFIVMNYCPGDQICCFGFSRGAYTARAVAGLITDIGIIQPKEMDDFPDLYRTYRKYRIEDGATFRESKDYRQWITGKFEGDVQIQKAHSLPPESTRFIEVEGVFDTVGALGVPYLLMVQQFLNQIATHIPFIGIDYQGFHRTSLSNYTKHAFHALSLDEHMAPFEPTLWHLPKADDLEDYRHLIREDVENDFQFLLDSRTATDTELHAAWNDVIKAQMVAEPKDFTPELRQVWFPGCHVNIGGGNSIMLTDYSYDFEQIALITFTWMCDQIAPFIRLDDEALVDDPEFSTLAHREIESRNYLMFKTEQDKNAGMSGFLWRQWRRVVYFMQKTSTTDNNRRADIWATGDILDVFQILGSFYILDIFVFFLKLFLPFTYTNRTPGHYKDEFQEGSETKEMIHPSTYYRMVERPDYKPYSLEPIPGREREDINGQNPQWKSKDVIIPGYVIRNKDRISRHLVNHSRANGFMDPLMEH
ncbi:hypothetical protein LY76DRAFT_588573 [Colletotrichum caudatum]|nr:hypothetical protein LY76DRAFT_588573 [Colletotrichum caudatum]